MLDVGDANLMLRLLAQIDKLRPWDVPQGDLNANAALDSGDVIKVLRAATGIEPQPVAAATVHSVKTGGLLTMERGLISPTVIRGSAANTVIVQVMLQDMSARISGAQFTLAYPTNALRLASVTSSRAGGLVPASAYTVWNPTRSGVTFATSSATDWAASNGVLAEITFEIQPGATNQFAWPISLLGMEVTSGGLNRMITPAGATFFSREPRAGTLSRMTRAADGEFRFSVSGDANCDYVIESSTDLKIWSPVQTLNSGTGLIQFNDPDAANRPQTFYRARPVNP